jgi:hypothetical protein
MTMWVAFRDNGVVHGRDILPAGFDIHLGSSECVLCKAAMT